MIENENLKDAKNKNKKTFNILLSYTPMSDLAFEQVSNCVSERVSE